MQSQKQPNDPSVELIKLCILKKLIEGDTQGLVALLQVFGSSSSDCHKGVTCDSCKSTNFTGVRFKCFECQDFDLCLSCFKQGKNVNSHKREHPMVAFRSCVPSEESNMIDKTLKDKDLLQKNLKNANIVHSCSECNICGGESIKGLRFKCEECPDYEMCYNCYKGGEVAENHKKNHRVIVFLSQIKEFDKNELEVNHNNSNSGCFGSVKKAKIKSSGKMVALKKIQANKEIIEYNYGSKSVYSNQGKIQKMSWENERKSYSEFYSEYIINSYGFWSERTADKTNLYIILEWMENGSLEQAVKNGESHRRLLQYAVQVARGLHEMHQKKFIHKDIKPDNILISKDKNAKLGDLGISMSLETNNELKFLAQRIYAAPQLLQGIHFNEKIDIFCYGLTLNFIFTGFEHKRQGLKVEFIKKSPYFYELILACISDSPSNRPSAKKIDRMFTIFDAGFWKLVGDKRNQYISLAVDKKNKVFDQVYNQIWGPVWKNFLEEQ